MLRLLLKRDPKFGAITEFKDRGGYVTPGFGSAMYINRAPHPNAGKVFLNWRLSKQGQTDFTGAMGYASRRTDVPKNHVPDYWIPRKGVK